MSSEQKPKGCSARGVLAVIVAIVVLAFVVIFFIGVAGQQANDDENPEWGTDTGIILDKESGEIIDMFDSYGPAPELESNEEIIYTALYNWRSSDRDPNVQDGDTPVIGITGSFTFNGEEKLNSSTVWLKMSDDMVIQYYNQLISEGHKYKLGYDLSPYSVVFRDVANALDVAKTNQQLPVIQFEPTEPTATPNTVISTLYASGMSATEALQGLGQYGGSTPDGSEVIGQYNFSCVWTALSPTNYDEYVAAISQITGVNSAALTVSFDTPVYWSQSAQPCRVDTFYKTGTGDYSPVPAGDTYYPSIDDR